MDIQERLSYYIGTIYTIHTNTYYNKYICILCISIYKVEKVMWLRLSVTLVCFRHPMTLLRYADKHIVSNTNQFSRCHAAASKCTTSIAHTYITPIFFGIFPICGCHTKFLSYSVLCFLSLYCLLHVFLYNISTAQFWSLMFRCPLTSMVSFPHLPSLSR